MPELVLYGIGLLAKQLLGTFLDIQMKVMLGSNIQPLKKKHCWCDFVIEVEHIRYNIGITSILPGFGVDSAGLHRVLCRDDHHHLLTLLLSLRLSPHLGRL